LIGRRPERLHQEVRAVLAGERKAGRVPPRTTALLRSFASPVS